MLSRTLGGIGRLLITGGTLILLFVSYQLWGTGIHEAQAQKELGRELEAALATTTTTASTSTSTTEPSDGEPALIPVEVRKADLPLPALGDAIAKIRIPAIGVTRTVVEGVSLAQLKRGPGHYPESPLPGQAGNVSIAGHRTTYGQPFHNLDKVKEGDEIITDTWQGSFVYQVTGVIIVKPNQVEILEDKGDNRITLIACHPKYSLRERIIVIGELVGQPAPEIEGQTEARQKAIESSGDLVGESIDGGLSGESASNTPAILWGLAAAAVWLATWGCQVLIRRRVRAKAADRGETPTRPQRLLSWTPYVIGFPVFMVTLYVFFENFGRLLPSNF